MRILLVHPGINGPGAVNDFPPWGALAVGSYLRSDGHEVEIFDACGFEICSALLDCVARFRPDVVGFTAKMGLAAARMRDAVTTLRSVAPSLPVFAGGPLTSTFPDLGSEIWSGVDALILGDGETGAAAWIDAGCPSNVTLSGTPLQNIDPFGLATWWEPLHHYVRPQSSWPGFGCSGLYVSGGRGCTKRCTFCYLNTHSPAHRFRYTTTETMFRFFDEAAATLGVGGFYFVDDCFLDADGVRLAEFAQAQADRAHPYRFGCDVQTEDLADPTTRAALWNAGFRALYVGLESYSRSVRRRLGKGAFKGSLDEAVALALADGFYVRASIGIGWPGETSAQIEDTIAFAERHPGLAFDAFRYTPLNGAPLSSFRAERMGERAGAADPMEDYSEYGRNWSALEDAQFLDLWGRFMTVRNRRETELAA